VFKHALTAICFLQKKLSRTQRVRWATLGYTKCDVYVNEKKYCQSIMLRLYIILHCRISDIQDNSILRRGVPVAHSIYGLASTISAAKCLIYRALEMVLSLNNPMAVTVFTEQVLELHRRQAVEIYWCENYVCPSVEEYQEMAKGRK
jgi:hypothetical protein